MHVEKLAVTAFTTNIDYIINQYTGLGYKHVQTLDDGTNKVRMIFEKAIPQNQAIPSNK